MNTKTWWTMKDLETETSKSRNWLKKKYFRSSGI